MNFDKIKEFVMTIENAISFVYLKKLRSNANYKRASIHILFRTAFAFERQDSFIERSHLIYASKII